MAENLVTERRGGKSDAASPISGLLSTVAVAAQISVLDYRGVAARPGIEAGGAQRVIDGVRGAQLKGRQRKKEERAKTSEEERAQEVKGDGGTITGPKEMVSICRTRLVSWTTQNKREVGQASRSNKPKIVTHAAPLRLTPRSRSGTCTTKKESHVGSGRLEITLSTRCTYACFQRRAHVPHARDLLLATCTPQLSSDNTTHKPHISPLLGSSALSIGLVIKA
jgi:hypothetical protein